MAIKRNPPWARDEIILILPDADHYLVCIIGINGKTVKQYLDLTGERITINIEDMEPGIYFISLKSIHNGYTYYKKFMKI